MDQEQSFRDTISTVDDKGKRIWVYPKKPKGWFYDKRKYLSYLLLLVLFGLPYLKIDGEPVVLFNVIERKFVFFGQIFLPQDMYIFALAMITLVVFITLFTIIFGRLFCGWICPQTIFMEMVFRRIEYWIEGDWTHQKKLNKQPWNAEKIRKKTIKHILFWFISFFIANTFLAYIIGYEDLFEIIKQGPIGNIGGFIAIVIFTFVFYGVFAFMREQVCTTVCPYGRLQGVLLDKNSLVVAYDYIRGEGRGKFRKNEDRKEVGKGDCIDCNQCVNVCPTGIDIRNGTQLECVNCTACIDACDAMMENVNLPKGLIKIASEDGIKNNKPFIWTTRVKVYVIILTLLIGALGALLISRDNIETTILRTRGTLFQKYDEDHFSNIYDLTIINKTRDEMDLTMKILEGPGKIELIGKELHLGDQTELHTKFMIVINKEEIESNIDCVIGLYDGDELIDEINTSFLGPNI
jgi:cytochrome c oxidase accessory protein FixG